MKERMKRFLSVLLTIAMVLAISLPVMAEEDTGGTETAVPSKVNNTPYETVHVTVTEDKEATIYLYKIIDLLDKVESEGSESVVDGGEAYSMAWISPALKAEVEKYVSNNTFKNGELDLANNPALLNSLSRPDESDDFYQWLAGLIESDTYEDDGSGNKVGEDYGCIRVSRTGDTNTSGTITTHLFTDVPTGGYLAVASGGVNVYRPTLVDLLPEKSETGEVIWNTSDGQEFVMKASKPTVDKKVTDNEEGDDAVPANSATVAIGDSLSYDIYTDVPVYSDDYDEDAIRYTMVDIISTVFEYDSTEPITIKGYNVVNGTLGEGTDIDSSSYTSATAGKVYVDADGNILFISTGFSSNNTFYWPDGGIMGATNLTDAISKYNSVNDNATILSSNVTVSTAQYAIIVDFTGHYADIYGYDKIGYHYNVTVKDTVEVGVDTNSNTAELAYSTNPADETETSTSDKTVSVYTFGVDITKKDATTSEGLNTIEFYLYKKLGTMTESEYNDLVAGDAEDQYQSVTATDDNVTVYERIFTDKKLVTGDVTTGDGEDADTESGKLLVGGLDVGDYLLVEVAPLGGYNPLDEPVSFTIAQNKTYPQYVSGGQSTGYFSLEVLNYQGITLPSTGGMGITMFVIIGMGLAGAAIIMLRMQRRKIYR